MILDIKVVHACPLGKHFRTKRCPRTRQQLEPGVSGRGLSFVAGWSAFLAQLPNLPWQTHTSISREMLLLRCA